MTFLKNKPLAIASMALLSAAMILTLPGCGRSPATPEESSVAEETVDPRFEFSKDFHIVRPERNNEYEIAALQLLSRCIMAVYGYPLYCTTDFVLESMGIVPGEYEILLGPTSRAPSERICSGLGADEAAYSIVDEHTIVIAGGRPAATFEAAVAFCRDVFGYEEIPGDASHAVMSNGSPAMLTPGTFRTLNVAFMSHYLNGTDLRDYKIVTELPEGTVSILAEAINEACGKAPEILAPSSYTAGPAIFLGYVPGTSGGHLDEAFDAVSYYARCGDGTIALDWGQSASAKAVLKDFAALIIPDASASGSVALRDGVTRLYTVTGEYNILYIESSETRRLAEGVEYTKLLYRDAGGLPVRAFAVAVESGRGRFYTCLPDDADSETAGKAQSVQNQVKAASGHGIEPLAAFNGGFFDMDGNKLSRGLAVHEGKVCAQNTTRPFFCQLRSGEVMILPASSYSAYKDSINSANAGSAILLRNGKAADIAQGTEMARTRHPRTGIGIDASTGRVVIMAVDGRQSSWSNGASYLDLVSLFRDQGCTELLNLDGGGSTTAVVISQNGSPALQNSPSGGSQRAVQDTLFVLPAD
jgi:hypothetical protein